MTVRVKDSGARRVLRDAKALQSGAHVIVGIIGEDADKPEGDKGVTVGDVAAWAEFGLGQPRRSWLRDWIDAADPEIRRRTSAEIAAVLAGTRTRDQALARLGVWAVGEIQKRIAAGIAPENAPSTIARKGSSTPLIDKGQFRGSITSKVVPK